MHDTSTHSSSQPTTKTIGNWLQRQDKNNKLISLGIASAIVTLLLIALSWLIINPPTAGPGVITASSKSIDDLPHRPANFPPSRKLKPASPSAPPATAITATRSSPISIPIAKTPNDVPAIGMSIGFGASIGTDFGNSGPAPGIPRRMSERCSSSDRAQHLRKAGGKAGMDKAVLNSLRWLKTQQKEDGHWGDKFPVAMTAFALLCYSGHCETVDSPEFGTTVKKAIEYLIGVGEKNKGMMASTMDRNTSYEHAIAVYSLGEAYSMNKNARKPFKRISPILKKAVPIIIEGQTNGGGWLYSYGSNGTGDLSVAGWNIQALKAAEYTGLKFSGLTTAKKKAVKYLKVAEDPKGSDGYFKYRIRDSDKGKLTLTGVGLLCQRMLGAPGKLENKGLDLILKKAPTKWDKPNLYAWYYHSQAAFQKGGKHWRKYNDAYQDVVFRAQEKDGSWPIPGGHAGSTGPDQKLYGTCLSTLMLEVYYRYLPTSS